MTAQNSQHDTQTTTQKAPQIASSPLSASDLAAAFPANERRFVQIFCAVFAVIMLSGYFVPRFMAYAPALLGLFGAIGFRGIFKTWPVIPRGAIGVIGVILALVFSSALWAEIMPNHGDIALERGIKISMVLVPALALFGIVSSVPPALLRVYAPRFFVPVFLIGGAFLTFDLYANSLIYSAIRDIPWPDINFNLSGLNRSVIIATVFALTIPAFIRHYQGGKQHRLFVITLVLMAAMLYQTNSQSSHLAIICGLVIYALCPSPSRKALWTIMSVSFIATFLTAPWIAKLLFSDFAPLVGDMAWFQNGYAANRMEIWDYVARYALESPWIGHGIDATRVVPAFDSGEIYQPGTTILHPHNFAIQIWIEFGALGALIFSALFAYVFNTIRRVENAVARSTALAVFIALAAAGSTGYGLWQGWWIGTFVMMTSICICIVKITHHNYQNTHISKKT